MAYYHYIGYRYNINELELISMVYNFGRVKGLKQMLLSDFLLSASYPYQHLSDGNRGDGENDTTP